MKSKLSLTMIITIITALLLPGVVLSRQEDDIMKPFGLPKKNKALYLGWGGYVDTKLDFSRFFNSDHTVMAWFMPQYPYANSGPIFAVNGTGKYSIGQADYREGDGGFKDKGWPVFAIQVGSTRVIYLLNGFSPGQWQHIAVVRKNNKFELYVNGSHEMPDKDINKITNTWKGDSEITVSASSTDLPEGALRFGRVDPDRSDPQQAYGLLDDAAVFNKALNLGEITEIMQKRRLRGTQDGLFA